MPIERCEICPTVDGKTELAIARVPLVTKRWSADEQHLVPAGVDWFRLCEAHYRMAKAVGDVSRNAPTEFLL